MVILNLGDLQMKSLSQSLAVHMKETCHCSHGEALKTGIWARHRSVSTLCLNGAENSRGPCSSHNEALSFIACVLCIGTE